MIFPVGLKFYQLFSIRNESSSRESPLPEEEASTTASKSLRLRP
jgi:hypothetical protein